MRYICYQDEPKPLTCLNPEVGAIAVILESAALDMSFDVGQN